MRSLTNVVRNPVSVPVLLAALAACSGEDTPE
jgi:hypothetical protein